MSKIYWNDFAENVKDVIERLDRYTRPYAVVCNTSRVESLKKEIGSQFKIIGSPEIEMDKFYVINRETFEEWASGNVSILRGEENE